MNKLNHFTRFAVLILFLCFHKYSFGQGFYFGPKGGLNIALQDWNSFERDPLFSFHGDAFIESLDPNGTGSLFASLGYHVRGSATRITNSFFNYTQGFRFNNISLMLGAKRTIKSSGKSRTYYHIGIRGEYTVNTNLDDIVDSNFRAYLPFDLFTNKITYGISGGAGYEIEVSEFVKPFLELTLSPDLNLQYMQGPIANVEDPFTGQLTTLPERNIRNFTIELSVGFKFLRKVIYMD